MRLRQLTALESDKIRAEHKDIVERIKELREILGDEGRVMGLVKDELQEISDTYGDERRTEITHSEDEIDEHREPNPALDDAHGHTDAAEAVAGRGDAEAFLLRAQDARSDHAFAGEAPRIVECDEPSKARRRVLFLGKDPGACRDALSAARELLRAREGGLAVEMSRKTRLAARRRLGLPGRQVLVPDDDRARPASVLHAIDPARRGGPAQDECAASSLRSP